MNYIMYVKENFGRLIFFKVMKLIKGKILLFNIFIKKIKILFVFNLIVIILRKCMKIIISLNVVVKIYKILY